MQPILAALVVSFIAGLAVRKWNAMTFVFVAFVSLAAAAVLYGFQGYM